MNFWKLARIKSLTVADRGHETFLLTLLYETLNVYDMEGNSSSWSLKYLESVDKVDRTKNDYAIATINGDAMRSIELDSSIFWK